MTKSALITILSAAGVGLVKSKMGSSSKGDLFKSIDLEIQFTASEEIAADADGQLIDAGSEMEVTLSDIKKIMDGTADRYQERFDRGENVQIFEERHLKPLNQDIDINFSNLKYFLSNIEVKYVEDKVYNDIIFWEVAQKLIGGEYGTTVKDVLNVMKLEKEGFDNSKKSFNFQPFAPEYFEDYLGNTEVSFKSFCENLIRWGLSDGYYYQDDTWMSNKQAFVFLLNYTEEMQVAPYRFLPENCYFKQIITVNVTLHLLNTWSKKEIQKFIQMAVYFLTIGPLEIIDVYWGTNFENNFEMNYFKTNPPIEEIEQGDLYQKALSPTLRKK